MSEHIQFPRVRLVAQPLSLGVILVAIGGYFGWHMLNAYDFSEPLWLQLSNLVLILAFGALFVWGISNLLALLQQVRIEKGEVNASPGMFSRSRGSTNDSGFCEVLYYVQRSGCRSASDRSMGL